jgi:hypothetical protein
MYSLGGVAPPLDFWASETFSAVISDCTTQARYACRYESYPQPKRNAIVTERYLLRLNLFNKKPDLSDFPFARYANRAAKKIGARQGQLLNEFQHQEKRGKSHKYKAQGHAQSCPLCAFDFQSVGRDDVGDIARYEHAPGDEQT